MPPAQKSPDLRNRTRRQSEADALEAGLSTWPPVCTPRIWNWIRPSIFRPAADDIAIADSDCRSADCRAARQPKMVVFGFHPRLVAHEV